MDTPSSKTEHAVVLYDADCGFCRWSLAKILAWDRRGHLRPVPIESQEGARLLSGLGEEERSASWHLIDAEERRHSAGAAVAPLFRELPGGMPPARLMERFPGATERAYSWVARHRSALGRPITGGARRRADARIRSRIEPA
jgi:predicted DCC family thiol-disulfide oxidoreductase YuxK